jgi:S-adenosylmethionine hydrolase
MPEPVITLTTDFGARDAYVAAMKGVILDTCPGVRIVDVTHEVRPQAIAEAAYVLASAAPYFARGTVHVVVVDPGVGTSRRAIAVKTARAFYVAPDNGALTLALEKDPARAVVHLTDRRYHLPWVSATFHGRDVFAPAAAHLACGTTLGEMGESIPSADMETLDVARVDLSGRGPWEAEVLHVDRFGNLITNVRMARAGASDGGELVIEAGGARIEGLRRTFGEVAPGALVAYVGSSGYLEVAVRGGNAADVLRLDVGDTLVVQKQ